MKTTKLELLSTVTRAAMREYKDYIFDSRYGTNEFADAD
jgi:hypothetical protein